MTFETQPQHLTLADLAQRCAHETELFRLGKTHDPQYCFELFRRAIVSHDQVAWEAINSQYYSQVERWVHRHPEFPLVQEEVEDFIAEAFERFWKYFTPDKFGKSQSLAAILSYLQMCVSGAVLDCRRKMRHRELEQEEGDEERNLPDREPTPEVLLQKEEFWQLIQERLKDKKEYMLIYASFSLDLSPREILVEFPGVFHDIEDIYQCKANVLARLNRDPELKKFLGSDD
jgi:RNA polymerase sigma factor (sigma-70 family)